jgi:hypothetical protein
MKRVLIVLFLIGCGPSGFDPPTIVMGPRVLSIVSEPVEAAPGADFTFRPMLAQAEGVELTWAIDLSTRALAASAGQYQLGETAAAIELEWDGERALLSGGATQAAIDALFAELGEAPPGAPEAVVREVYETVGLTLVVNLVGRDAEGAIVIDAFKRVVLTPRADVTTNPPAPRFAIGGTWVSARGGEPFVCAPESDAPVVSAGSVVILSPEPDETWIETFPSIDIEGRTVQGTEDAYYSWFSTAGAFSFATTRPPDRDVEWTAPEEPGTYPLWLVVRDGHLGGSACRAEVTVH